MKKGILTLLLCVSFLAEGNAACLRDGYYETGIANYVTIELRCEYINPTIKATEIKRAPMKAPTIGFDGRTLYLYGQFGGLTLELADNGAAVYSTVVEPNANEVTLPDMPGTYELRLCDGRFVYSCAIEII